MSDPSQPDPNLRTLETIADSIYDLSDEQYLAELAEDGITPALVAADVAPWQDRIRKLLDEHQIARSLQLPTS